jgi:hypothetical protein
LPVVAGLLAEPVLLNSGVSIVDAQPAKTQLMAGRLRFTQAQIEHALSLRAVGVQWRPAHVSNRGRWLYWPCVYCYHRSNLTVIKFGVLVS